MGEISAQVFARPSWLTVPAPEGFDPADSPLTEDLAEVWQLNEAARIRYSSIGGTRLKPYSGSVVDTNAVGRVAGPSGYAAQFVAADSAHLSTGISDASFEAIELGGLGTTGWWIWAWVKFSAYPVSSAYAGVICKQDDVVGVEYALALYNNGGTYNLRALAGAAEASQVVTPDTTNWHLLEAWYDPVADTLNVAWDNAAGSTAALATPHTSESSPIHIGTRQHSSGYLSGAIWMPAIRKRMPGVGERDELWNSGAGLPYPFDAVTPGTRGAVVDNTDGAAAVAPGSALPLFLPGSFDWDSVYYGNGDDIAATDANGDPLLVWPESVDKGNRCGRLWVETPSVPVGDTAEIALSHGDPAQHSQDNYDTLFSKRTADADTEALFHCDVVTVPAFDPGAVAGLALDLNPQVFGLVDNDPITTAVDDSGVGNNFTAAGAARPTLKDAILNGKPVMRFDGGDHLAGPASSVLISASARTEFVVAKVTTFAAQGYSSASHIPAFLLDVDTYHGLGATSGAAGTAPEVVAGHYDGAHKTVSIATDTNWHIWKVRHEAGTLYLSVDGGAEVSVAAGNVGALSGLTRIGANSTLTAFLTGDTARHLVYNTALSSGDETYVLNGLATEYGL